MWSLATVLFGHRRAASGLPFLSLPRTLGSCSVTSSTPRVSLGQCRRLSWEATSPSIPVNRELVYPGRGPPAPNTGSGELVGRP